MSRNNEVQRGDRRMNAIELRRAGKSFREIAEKLECNASTVLRDVRAALKEQSANSETVDEQRDLELARYDRYLAVLEDNMGSGFACPECGRTDVKTIEAAIKVSKARRELKGLDAPTKTQAVEPDDIAKMSAEQKRDAHLKAAAELEQEMAEGKDGMH